MTFAVKQREMRASALHDIPGFSSSLPDAKDVLEAFTGSDESVASDPNPGILKPVAKPGGGRKSRRGASGVGR